MSSADHPRRGTGSGRRTSAPGAVVHIETPRLPGWRDPWMWASALAIVPLVLHSLGAPLGEPAAEDWDFLHRTLLTGDRSLLDGGGSSSFWRPIPHQIYYLLLSTSILERPLAVAALHALLLAVTAVLAYRAARTRLPAAGSAVIACFPLLAESTRSLIAWPSHMVELSFILFSILALHEAAFRRLPTALLALLAALLCKEVAVVTALILPWVPRLTAGAGVVTAGVRRERWRWVLGSGAVTLAWGLAYLAVRQASHLRLPHALETSAVTDGTSWLLRYLWVAVNSVRAAFSLPVVGSPWEFFAWGGLLVIAGAAAWTYATSREARARFRPLLPVVVAGVAWFLVAAMPLTVVYPFWMPHRTGFGSFGLALALAGTLGAARPALLVGLVALRLAMFAVSPGASAQIPAAPPASGAFLDVAKLARLQRFMVETRRTLMERFPTLPHGARVGLLHPPLMTEYAFGGSRALQVWYRDTTLRWLRYDEFRRRPDLALAAIVHYEPERTPQVMLLEPAAMRHYLLAGERVRDEDWSAALVELATADTIQSDTTARMFAGRVAGRRALCRLGLADLPGAEREARRALTLWRESNDARYTLVSVLAFTGRRRDAEAHLDTLIRLYPDDSGARTLRDSLDAWTGPAR